MIIALGSGPMAVNGNFWVELALPLQFLWCSHSAPRAALSSQDPSQEPEVVLRHSYISFRAVRYKKVDSNLHVVIKVLEAATLFARIFFINVLVVGRRKKNGEVNIQAIANKLAWRNFMHFKLAKIFCLLSKLHTKK